LKAEVLGFGVGACAPRRVEGLAPAIAASGVVQPGLLGRRLPVQVPGQQVEGLEELETLDVPALVVASYDEADPGHPYAIAAAWGILGVTVLPRTDAAGALGVPLLLAFLWRSRARAAYAGVFLVVAALELYGTAIGTWRWAEQLPGLGIPDGNPPSGVASGYVWFDVMALLLAPRLLAAAERTWPLRRRLVPGTERV